LPFILLSLFLNYKGKVYLSVFITSFKLKKFDLLYSFSDGYPDQFGGNRYEKFMTGRLKKFILSIADTDMEKQNKLIRENFYKWKSHNYQLDDVLMLGLKYIP